MHVATINAPFNTYFLLWSTHFRFSSPNNINSGHTCREKGGEVTQRLDGVVTGASRTNSASRDGHRVHHIHCYGIVCHILADSREKFGRILDIKGMREYMELNCNMPNLSEDK